MAEMTAAAFGRTLSAKNFESGAIYLLYGSERQRTSDAARRLKDRVVAERGEENYFRYPRLGTAIDDSDAADLVARLNTVSMFGGGGALLWAGPLDSLSKQDTKILAAYAENPNPASTLILSIIPGKGDKRATTTFGKSALVKAIAKTGTVVSFGPLAPAEAKKWAKARFAARGATIGNEAVTALLERTDKNLGRANGEIEKLVSYLDEGAEVTLAHVEELVGDSRGAQMWDTLRAIRRHNLKAALASLDSLLAQNIPWQMLLKMLTSELMRLYAAIEFRERGERLETFVAEMGMPSFILREVYQDASGWDEPAIRLGLRGIKKAQMEMMASRVAPESALTALVTRLCSQQEGQ